MDCGRFINAEIFVSLSDEPPCATTVPTSDAHTPRITLHWVLCMSVAPWPQTGEGTLFQVYVWTHRLKVSGTQQTKLSGGLAEGTSIRVSW